MIDRVGRWLLLAFVVLATTAVVAMAPSTTTATTYAYDAISVSRVDVHEIDGAVAFAALLNDLRWESGAPAVSARAPSPTPSVAFVATEAAGGAADDLTRVGRWMSPEEHAAMVRTGEVQVGAGGTTYVANPANVNAFTPNRLPSNYVEFDVPTSSLRPGQTGWAQIPSPDSVWGRLAAKQGVSVQSPVPACNIVLVATKSSC